MEKDTAQQGISVATVVAVAPVLDPGPEAGGPVEEPMT